MSNTLRRDELMSFLRNDRLIREFESLGEAVNSGLPTDITDTLLAAIIATINAQAAVDKIEGVLSKYRGGLTISSPVNEPVTAAPVINTNAELGSMAAQSNRKVKITGGEVAAVLKNTRETLMLENTMALNDGAAASTATMTNAPLAGNPTKWIPILDGSVIRYIPAW